MKKVKICTFCGENTIQNHAIVLKVDYFVIGDTPSGLKELSSSKLRTEDNIYSKVIFIELTPQSLSVLSRIKPSQHQNTKYIYTFKEPLLKDLPKWQPLFNKFKPYRFISFFEEDIKPVITHAKEEILEFEQNEELKKLKVQHQNSADEQLEELDSFSKKLLRSRQRTLQNKKNEQLNLNCIEIIFNSESISTLEEKLSEILNKSLSIFWIRILTNSAEILTDLPTIKFQNQFETLIYDIEIDQKVQGKIVFAKKQSKTFKKDEINVCQNISDALSLRIKQIVTQQKIKNIRQQWDSTFNAIPFKAALISKDYNLIKVGGQFKNKSSFENTKCYKHFWGRSTPCSRCKLGDNFLIDHKNESLEVNSKEIFDPTTEESFYLNFYRDFEVSTSKESSQASLSKLEELGLICGSIAHELNNPLGGIKILLDLIKDDPDAQSQEDQGDIKILKDSTEHCISTVRELLKFTRKQSDENATTPLLENINQVKIFTRAFLQSSGFELNILNSSLLEQEILAKNSTLTIRLLEMVSQFINKLSQSKITKREVFLACELSPSELKITLSSEKPELRQELTTPLKTPLYLDPTKVVLEEGAQTAFVDVLSFQL